MFDFVNSVSNISYRFKHSVDEQVDMMKECVKHGLRPFDYFDTGMYLNNKADPKDYIGIQQARDLWRKYNPANQMTLSGETFAELFNHKPNTKRWLVNRFVAVPRTQTVREFIHEKRSFVIKPTNGHGGKGVVIYKYCEVGRVYRYLDSNELVELNMLNQYASAEEYIEPIKPSKCLLDPGYDFGSIRVMIFTRGGKSHHVASAMKFRWHGNAVDNYALKHNGVVGVTGSKFAFDMALEKGGDEYISLPSIYVGEAPQNLNVHPMIVDILRQVSSTIASNQGMFLGYDVMLMNRAPGWCVLEVNGRPGFDILQVAHRTGARPWIESFL